MKLGIMGGSFNPVHVGHLLVAQDVLEGLALDRVVFVPAARPWMKPAAELAPVEDRWEMVCRAIAGNPRFSASRVDIERRGPSFATDTVRDLRRDGGPDDDYYFILGMDSLDALPEWKRVEELLSLCRLAVVERPGSNRGEALGRLEAKLPKAFRGVQVVKAAHVDVSATEIRRRVREGRPITYRVPAGVEAYIAERGLYR